jgi:hypothetical protein
MHAARLFSHLRLEAIWTTFGLLGLEMSYFLKGFCARRTRPFRPIWSGLSLPVAHQQEAVPPPPVPFFCRSSCCLRTGVACASTDAQTHATELHSGHRGGATSNCGRRRTRRTDKYKRDSMRSSAEAPLGQVGAKFSQGRGQATAPVGERSIQYGATLRALCSVPGPLSRARHHAIALLLWAVWPSGPGQVVPGAPSPSAWL